MRLGSHTPLFEQWERHLSHQGRLDELFLLFSDSKKAGEDQPLAGGASERRDRAPTGGTSRRAGGGGAKGTSQGCTAGPTRCATRS